MNQANYRTRTRSLLPATAILLMTAGAGFALAETAAAGREAEAAEAFPADSLAGALFAGVSVSGCSWLAVFMTNPNCNLINLM